MHKKALIAGGKKEAADYIKIALGSDFPVIFADPARKIKAKRQIEIIFFPCDFQCSLADCFPGFKFAHLCRDIPFAVVRFLPVDKRIQPEPVFSLSFFESYNLSPSQEKMIDKLRSSEFYSRNLMSRLRPSHIVSKVLILQTEIAENPNEIYDLKKSAETAGLSPCWLSHKFREISGITLERFILKNHFCRGLWNIINTDKLIKIIALDLGYKPASFSERFKKHFGATPSFIRVMSCSISRLDQITAPPLSILS